MERFQRVNAVPFYTGMHRLISETPTYSQDNWFHNKMRGQNSRCIDNPDHTMDEKEK